MFVLSFIITNRYNFTYLYDFQLFRLFDVKHYVLLYSVEYWWWNNLQIAENNKVYEPKETASVAEAKRQHAILYEQIAQQHAQLAAELEAARIEAERQELLRKQSEEAAVTQPYGLLPSSTN